MSEDNIDDYEELVNLAVKQRDDKSRLKGSLDVVVKNLRDLGYKNISEAKKDLLKKKALLRTKISDRSKKIITFKSKYGKHLQK